MNNLELIIHQTEDTYNWANKLIDSVPMEKWEITPPILETNLSWQIGHLIVSFYFHSVLVITGHRMDVLSTIPLKQYDALFISRSPKEAIGSVTPETLKEHLLFMQQKSIAVIKSLSEEDLSKALVPGAIPHPIAKTRLDALDWNIKHTLWHCGQIGLLKRIVDRRYEFGLQR